MLYHLTYWTSFNGSIQRCNVSFPSLSRAMEFQRAQRAMKRLVTQIVQA